MRIMTCTKTRLRLRPVSFSKVASTEVSGKTSATSQLVVSPKPPWSKFVSINPITLPAAEVSSVRVTMETSNGKRKNHATLSVHRPRRKDKARHSYEDDSLSPGCEEAPAPVKSALAPHRKGRWVRYRRVIEETLLHAPCSNAASNGVECST
jgi:hypothetical protein